MGTVPSSLSVVFEHEHGHIRICYHIRSAQIGWGLDSGCAGGFQHVHEGKADVQTSCALREESRDVAWRFACSDGLTCGDNECRLGLVHTLFSHKHFMQICNMR